ncbi:MULTISPECIES: ABC-three component system protein [unclassified Enterococcus]|jgi:DNA-directed RNA polymerase subunit RPC12/RpoP|uniref:ABC-three component system protein n=1 Tax=unclassified Enterococcus TaxID=2608891 RepID=UPI003D2D2F04
MGVTDNRRIPTENEKLLLHTEVDGRCPMCGNSLTYKKGTKIYKSFEIAHIYPANPKEIEKEILKDMPLLDSDVNNLKNLIAVCPRCHTKFDNPRTTDEYMKWYIIKQKLLSNAELRQSFYLFNIEEELKNILEKLDDEAIEEQLVQLNLNSLRIDQKTNETMPYAIKRSIKNDVVDYFDYIKNVFLEMDKISPRKFDTLASQVKSFYLKCSQSCSNQNQLFVTLVDWLDEKTEHYSKRACEIVIAFFIQDCEVF